MVKAFLIDDDLHKRFVDAVSIAHEGHAYGNISLEHKNALENHIKLMEKKK